MQFPLGGELRSHILCGTGKKLNEKRSYPKLTVENCAWPGLYMMDLMPPLSTKLYSGCFLMDTRIKMGKTGGLGPLGAVSLGSGQGFCPATQGTSGPAWAPGGGGADRQARAPHTPLSLGSMTQDPPGASRPGSSAPVPTGGRKRPGFLTLSPAKPPEHPVLLFPGSEPLAVPPFLHLQGQGLGQQHRYLLTLDVLTCQRGKQHRYQACHGAGEGHRKGSVPDLEPGSPALQTGRGLSRRRGRLPGGGHHALWWGCGAVGGGSRT